MNIKNRLKRLQSRIIGNDSNFCDCQKEPQITILIPTPDGGKTTLDGKHYIEPAKICATCGKPNPEPFHTTFVIKPAEGN